ncbi:MAG: apolipoprotein N-acyltransferase, partial [Myxococcota bacterium]
MQYLLAALTGALVALAYPLVGAWPLIFVAWTPLMVAIEGASPRRRFLLGWLAGIVATMGIQYWLAGSVVRLTGAPWWAAILALASYSAFIGCQLGFFALAYGPLRRFSGRMAWIVTVPVAFALIEQLYPVVFPIHAGNALWQAPVLMQSAEWIGVSGLTWLVLLSSCGLTFVIEEIGRGRTSDHFVPTAIAGLWVMLGMWGLVRMDQVWSAPVQGSPTVALVQPNVTVAEKQDRDPRVRQEVYRRTVQMTRDVLAKRP